MRFWDSSALLPLCVNEPHSKAMKELAVEDPAIVVWWATPIECRSALARLVQDGYIDEAGLDDAGRVLGILADAWTEVQPTDDVRRSAARLLRVHPLRAADSLQLAAALVWSEMTPEGQTVVCLDEQLRTAAGKEGFDLLPA